MTKQFFIKAIYAILLSTLLIIGMVLIGMVLTSCYPDKDEYIRYNGEIGIRYIIGDSDLYIINNQGDVTAVIPRGKATAKSTVVKPPLID